MSEELESAATKRVVYFVQYKPPIGPGHPHWQDREESGSELCLAGHDDLICCLPAGHAGSHVAYGGDNQLWGRWFAVEKSDPSEWEEIFPKASKERAQEYGEHMELLASMRAIGEAVECYGDDVQIVWAVRQKIDQLEAENIALRSRVADLLAGLVPPGGEEEKS